jgi:DNA-binding response OmpR family regulator
MVAVAGRTRTAEKTSPNVLVMEGEFSVAKGLEMVLSEEGYDVAVAATGQAALEIFREKGCDVLVADLRLPDIDGMDVVRLIKSARPDTIVVVITGYASVDSAVESMKLGAFDYLPKPFTDDQIKSAVGRAVKQKQAELPSVSAPETTTAEEKLIQKREIFRVLNRTAEDRDTWNGTMEGGGSEALRDYHLSDEAKAAIGSADLKWLNEQIGELSQKQLAFIFKRLERQAY